MLRAQQSRLTWPLNENQVQSIDDMFDTLFKAIKNGSITVSANQITAGVLPVINGGTNSSTALVNGRVMVSIAGKITENVAGTSSQVLHGNLVWSGINAATDITGILPPPNGGTGTGTAFTPGSIVFAGTSGIYTQDNANFFWDGTNHKLGVGTNTPATSAIVELATTTGALLVPRMTTTQRNALTAVNGMIIYNTTTTVLEGYMNGVWTSMSGSSITLPLSPANGGTGTSTVFTAGSVVFAGASGIYQQDNANFFWDDTHFRLGIGTTDPTFGISVGSASRILGITGDGTASAAATGYIIAANNRGTATVADTAGLYSFASKNNGDGIEVANILASLTGAGGTHGFGSDLKFFTKPNNVVALSLALSLHNNQTVTMPGYGTGVAQFNSSGDISSSTALANGTTATTQAALDNSTKVATTAYADSAVAGFFLKSITQRLTNTQLVAMSTTTPVTIVPTPSSGHIVIPVFATYQEHTVGAYNTGRNLQLRYNGTTTVIGQGLALNTVIRDRLWLLWAFTTPSQFEDYGTNDPRTKAIEAILDGAVIGGNAANFIDVTVLYYDITSSI